MFRTSSVHHQERFVQAVFADFRYVVIRVLLDTSSRCKVVGATGCYLKDSNFGPLGYDKCNVLVSYQIFP